MAKTHLPDLIVLSEEQIKNIFYASCVENVASALNIPTRDAYQRMKSANLFREIIFPCYDALHSQSRQAVTYDLLEALRVREEEKQCSSTTEAHR